ncbi:elongation factor-like GTPase 1 [Biomphalaria glabrata]|uniref:Ribosome assembly protein 1 n=1 Tax=Biomphalaria glabrata TaxID=6526 RepID=A0A9W3BLS3_BIOGL|nr:elongation factor-like GTPase 1 [Biomphalaria glabrata]XP_055900520.1 elongation factor-like GTPase 1 [Biomphalaria glabrata]XP_055900525.1 elongation factor-like GTPase 1 [Biomphalaria glabrata]XP_055900529.1 elongation factor-like GTPase 1 [Biomphalaria glabrata]XP_055900537.1 elongation factor-like GTPase 1 [Biomphalaria glabrata]
MKLETLKEVRQLQSQPSKIRNICILAHVDHGKTTIADSLVASNGIISKRNAGKIRYMDSRPDEQERGITMKSSAITLIYDKSSKKTDNNPSSDHYLINLIDSPGHVDFSSEVTTAVRLCDGAIVVVDVVEGVCPQTQAVLQQSWLENIRPILVLNKIDRLISQLKMTPIEAYYHLIQILEQMNLFTNQLFTSNAMEKLSSETDKESKGVEINSYDWTVIEDEEDHKNIFFSPDLGNVIFASALDGWGFRLGDFTHLYATKLGVEEEILHKTMWGDYYINMKAKRIMKGAQSNGKKPLFVQFVLDNIWSAYDAVLEKKDAAMTEKIIKSLELSIPPRDTRHKDPRVLLQAIMGLWLPLSNAILDTVTTCLPSPLEISDERVQQLMCNKSQQFSSLPKETQDLKKDFQACSSSSDAPVIVYISKMFPMDKTSLPQNRARPLTDEELQHRRDEARKRHAAMQQEKLQSISSENDNLAAKPLTTNLSGTAKVTVNDENDYVFIAVARIFSGTLRKNSTVFFLGPKHNPGEAFSELCSLSPEEFQSRPELQVNYPHIIAVHIKDLYLLMGRELEALDEVSVGNVFGIGGLESIVLKSGTLSSTVACPAFTDMFFDTSPIVRVAVEPANACDMNALITGLKLLNQADPCVEVRVQETGEHVIIAAGEVHLQRCIDDLRERYGKIEVNVSKPIVPFRETIVLPPKVDMVNESIQDQGDDDDNNGIIQASTINRQCHLLLRAAPLPGEVAEILHQNQQHLKLLDSMTSSSQCALSGSAKETFLAIKQKLKEEFEKAGPEWSGAENCIWCFGPRRCGPNILLNHVKCYNRPSVWQPLEPSEQEPSKLVEFDNSIVTGFQLATLAGPLCEEPMHGVCIIVEDWWYGEKTKSHDLTQSTVNTEENIDSVNKSLSQTALSDSIQRMESEKTQPSKHTSVIPGFDSVQLQDSNYGPLSGQLISSVKDGCRRAFQAQPQRLMAAMYSCEIQANMDVLGKLHGVLAKRYGQILSDDLMEGTAIFNIKAVLPVIESFGFAEDMRKKTSGLASPQLKFSHWEVIPVDPFWVPTTEEEYMHYGEKADAENRARVYMNQVRKRKGLSTNEKIVEFAEKQRTLTKNK